MKIKLKLIIQRIKILIKRHKLPITEIYRFFKLKRPYMPPPLWIYLEPTTKCNFNCLTCSRKSLSPTHINKNLSLTEFKYIISNIPGLNKIHLQGLGEPLLNKDLWKITQYGRMKGIRFTTTLNGSLINQNNVDKLLKSFIGIGISLDSTNEENYNKIRRGGNFKRIMENIQLLLKRKKELNSNTVIGFNFVVTHLNFNELEDYLQLCEKMGMECSIVEVENWYIPTQKEYKQEFDFIKKSREYHEKIRSLILRYKIHLEKRGLNISYGMPFKRKHICLWPFTSCFVSCDGYITPCCIRQDPSIINFGNIFKTPFKKIWNSKKYQIFRNTMLKRLPNIICDNCPD